MSLNVIFRLHVNFSLTGLDYRFTGRLFFQPNSSGSRLFLDVRSNGRIICDNVKFIKSLIIMDSSVMKLSTNLAAAGGMTRTVVVPVRIVDSPHTLTSISV